MPNRCRRRWSVPAASLVAALAFSVVSAARAASVPYVGSVPVTAAPQSGPAAHLTGPVIATRSVSFLLLDPRFDAEYDLRLENSVVRAADTGRLDFYYRVTNASRRPLHLLDMDTGRFTRPGSVDPIDVNLWDDRAGTYAPLLADRTGSHFSGVALDFPADETLGPGESTRLFFVRTDATRFELQGLTQFRSTPDTTTDSGFALTFNPVLDGPVVPPPAVVTIPLPPEAPWAGALAFFGIVVGRRAWRTLRAGQLIL